jgi:hypothetical protein
MARRWHQLASPARWSLEALASPSPARRLHQAIAAWAQTSGSGDATRSAPPPPPDGSLYDTHVPLHPIQKAAVAAFASLGALIRCVPGQPSLLACHHPPSPAQPSRAPRCCAQAGESRSGGGGGRDYGAGRARARQAAHAGRPRGAASAAGQAARHGAPRPPAPCVLPAHPWEPSAPGLPTVPGCPQAHRPTPGRAPSLGA